MLLDLEKFDREGLLVIPAAVDPEQLGEPSVVRRDAFDALLGPGQWASRGLERLEVTEVPDPEIRRWHLDAFPATRHRRLALVVFVNLDCSNSPLILAGSHHRAADWIERNPRTGDEPHPQPWPPGRPGRSPESVVHVAGEPGDAYVVDALTSHAANPAAALPRAYGRAWVFHRPRSELAETTGPLALH